MNAGVSLASGDPLGDPEAWPGAIQAWLNQAATYAWIPAVLAASEPGGRAHCRPRTYLSHRRFTRKHALRLVVADGATDAGRVEAAPSVGTCHYVGSHQSPSVAAWK